MQQYSMNLEFEEAAKVRDLMECVRNIAQKQKITDSVGEDKDVIAIGVEDRDAVVQVFFIRDGKMIGREKLARLMDVMQLNVNNMDGSEFAFRNYCFGFELNVDFSRRVIVPVAWGNAYRYRNVRQIHSYK